MIIAVAMFAQAVSGRAGGVNQRDAGFRTDSPDIFGVVEIEFIENDGVFFGGICAGAHVEDNLYIIAAAVQPLDKIFAMDTGDVLFSFEVPVFIFPAEFIDQNEVDVSLVVEFFDYTAADEAGGACYYDHFMKFCIVDFKSTARKYINFSG